MVSKSQRLNNLKVTTYLTLPLLLLVLERHTLAADVNEVDKEDESSEVEGSRREPASIVNKVPSRGGSTSSSLRRESTHSNRASTPRESTSSPAHQEFERVIITEGGPAPKPSPHHSAPLKNLQMPQSTSLESEPKKSSSSGSPTSHSDPQFIQNPTIESTCIGTHVLPLVGKGMCQCGGKDKDTQYYFNSIAEPHELKICEYLIGLKELFASHSNELEYHYPNRLFCKATREFMSIPLATGAFGNRGSIDAFAPFPFEDYGDAEMNKKYTVDEQLERVRKNINTCEYQTKLIVEYVKQSAHAKDSEALFKDYSQKLNRFLPDWAKNDPEYFDRNVALDRDPGARTVKAIETLKGDHGGTRYKYVLRKRAGSWSDGRDEPEVQGDLTVFSRMKGEGRKFVHFSGYKWITKKVNSPPESIEVPDVVELQNSINLWNEKYKKLKNDHPDFFKNLSEQDQLAYAPLEVGFYNQPNDVNLTPRTYVKNLEENSFKLPVAEMNFKGDQTKFTHDITNHPFGLILQAKPVITLVSRQNRALREFEDYVVRHFNKQSNTLQFKHTFNRIFLGRSAFLDTFLSDFNNDLGGLEKGSSAFGGRPPSGFKPGVSAEETIQNLSHYKDLISDPSLKQDFQQAIEGFIQQERLVDPTFSQHLNFNGVSMAKRLQFLDAVTEDRLP